MPPLGNSPQLATTTRLSGNPAKEGIIIHSGRYCMPSDNHTRFRSLEYRLLEKGIGDLFHCIGVVGSREDSGKTCTHNFPILKKRKDNKRKECSRDRGVN